MIEESRARIGSAAIAPRAAAAANTPVQSPRRYADLALTSSQPRIGDLIPCRLWTLTVWTAFLLACVAGMQTLYGYVALGYLKIGSTRIAVDKLAAIDLASPANVARWFSAWLLGMAAVLGYLTYLIRRHRLDDYRGRYRMWYWVVALLILASLDQVAHLQTSLRMLLFELAAVPDDPRALLTWSLGLTLFVAVVGGRLAVEMRASRLAILGLLVATFCYAAVTAAQLGWIFTVGGIFRVMASSALAMGGHISLLGAFCLYARYVHREAGGHVPLKRRRKMPPTTGTATHRDSTDRGEPPVGQAGGQRAPKLRRIDPPHETPKSGGAADRSTPDPALSGGRIRKRRRTLASNATEPHAADAGPRSSEPVDGPSTPEEEARPLSKAERKRLRKQQRKQAAP